MTVVLFIVSCIMASPEKDSSAVDLYSDYPKELLYKVLVIGDFGVGEYRIHLI